MEFEARSWPGGELPMLWAALTPEFCARGFSVATIASARVSCGALLVDRRAAIASGAWVAAQMAGPLE